VHVEDAQGGEERKERGGEVLVCHEAVEVWEGERGLCEEGGVGGGEDGCGESVGGGA